MATHKPNAPPNLATDVAFLRTRLGQHQRAIEALREQILVTDDPTARKELILESIRQLGDLRRHGQLLGILQVHDMQVWCPHPAAGGVGLRPPTKVDGDVGVGEICVAGAFEGNPDLP